MEFLDLLKNENWKIQRMKDFYARPSVRPSSLFHPLIHLFVYMWPFISSSNSFFLSYLCDSYNKHSLIFVKYCCSNCIFEYFVKREYILCFSLRLYYLYIWYRSSSVRITNNKTRKNIIKYSGPSIKLPQIYKAQ